MANDCCGTMRVVAKNKEAIDRFERIMRYKDDEFFCYRVFQFERFNEYKDEEFYVADFSTDVAWGSDRWFHDSDKPDEKIVIGYEKTRKIVKPDGSVEMCEDWDKPIRGTAHYTSVRHLCEVLSIGVELWSTEPGMGFEEHADCDRNGDFHYETAEYREEYEDGEDGEPKEIHGFGDEFMEFMDLDDIYDHKKLIHKKEDNKMDANKRPSLVLCHANGKGTGSAMKMELYPARVGDPDSGAIYATIAPQSTFGDLGSTPPIYPRFDWGNAVKFRFDFTDLAKILQVLLGETESIDEGKGLFHRYADKCQVIKFRHIIEPVCGYSLEVSETSTDANAQTSERNARIFLSSAEALGISLAIEHSFAAIAFGVPVI